MRKTGERSGRGWCLNCDEPTNVWKIYKSSDENDENCDATNNLFEKCGECSLVYELITSLELTKIHQTYIEHVTINKLLFEEVSNFFQAILSLWIFITCNSMQNHNRNYVKAPHYNQLDFTFRRRPIWILKPLSPRLFLYSQT